MLEPRPLAASKRAAFTNDLFNQVTSLCLLSYSILISDKRKSDPENSDVKKLNGIFHMIKSSLKKVSIYDAGFKVVNIPSIKNQDRCEIITTTHASLSSCLSTLINSYQHWKIDLSADEVYFLIKAARMNHMLKEKLLKLYEVKNERT